MSGLRLARRRARHRLRPRARGRGGGARRRAGLRAADHRSARWPWRRRSPRRRPRCITSGRAPCRRWPRRHSRGCRRATGATWRSAAAGWWTSPRRSRPRAGREPARWPSPPRSPARSSRACTGTPRASTTRRRACAARSSSATRRSPRRSRTEELAASALNALAHAAEAPCTVGANPVSTLAAHQAARLIVGAYGAAGEPDRDALALGALLAGYAMDSTGYGLHHVLAQTVVQRGLAAHGAANAVLLPHTLAALARRAPAAARGARRRPRAGAGGGGRARCASARARRGCATSGSPRRSSTPARTPRRRARSSTSRRRARTGRRSARSTPPPGERADAPGLARAHRRHDPLGHVEGGQFSGERTPARPGPASSRPPTRARAARPSTASRSSPASCAGASSRRRPPGSRRWTPTRCSTSSAPRATRSRPPRSSRWTDLLEAALAGEEQAALDPFRTVEDALRHPPDLLLELLLPARAADPEAHAAIAGALDALDPRIRVRDQLHGGRPRPRRSRRERPRRRPRRAARGPRARRLDHARARLRRRLRPRGRAHAGERARRRRRGRAADAPAAPVRRAAGAPGRRRPARRVRRARLAAPGQRQRRLGREVGRGSGRADSAFAVHSAAKSESGDRGVGPAALPSRG